MAQHHLPSLAALGTGPAAVPTEIRITKMKIDEMEVKQVKILNDAFAQAEALAEEARRKLKKRRDDLVEANFYGGEKAMKAQAAKDAAEFRATRTCERATGLLKLLNHALKDLGYNPILQDDGTEVAECKLKERVDQVMREEGLRLQQQELEQEQQKLEEEAAARRYERQMRQGVVPIVPSQPVPPQPPPQPLYPYNPQNPPQPYGSGY